MKLIDLACSAGLGARVPAARITNVPLKYSDIQSGEAAAMAQARLTSAEQSKGSPYIRPDATLDVLRLTV